jgi:hypothetical protein
MQFFCVQIIDILEFKDYPKDQIVKSKLLEHNL